MCQDFLPCGNAIPCWQRVTAEFYKLLLCIQHQKVAGPSRVVQGTGALDLLVYTGSNIFLALYVLRIYRRARSDRALMTATVPSLGFFSEDSTSTLAE